jgi:hypothetical protein
VESAELEQFVKKNTRVILRKRVPTLWANIEDLAIQNNDAAVVACVWLRLYEGLNGTWYIRLLRYITGMPT